MNTHILIQLLSSEGLKVVGQGPLLPEGLPDEKEEEEEEEKERLQTLGVPHPLPSPWQCHGPAPALSTHCLPLTLHQASSWPGDPAIGAIFIGFRYARKELSSPVT